MLTMDSTIFRDAVGVSLSDFDDLSEKYGFNDLSEKRLAVLKILRVSEGCARKVWLLNYLAKDQLKAIASSAPKIAFHSAENLRLEVGNTLEQLAINAAKSKMGWHKVEWQQHQVDYYDEAQHTLMVGHIDGIVQSVEGHHLLEVKTTSDERFNEVRMGMMDEDRESEMLEKYRRQMRRYLAMLLRDETHYLHEVLDRTHGMLVVMNRNTCEVAVERVPLFYEGELTWRWLHDEIYEQTGGASLNTEKAPAVPIGYYRSHPICQTCMFWNACYTGEREAAAVSREQEALGEEYMHAEAMYKTGDAKKKRIRQQVQDLMREMEETKLQLGDDVVASKSSRRGSNRIDRDRMREDGVLDRYLVEGKPYEVVSLKVRR